MKEKNSLHETAFQAQQELKETAEKNEKPSQYSKSKKRLNTLSVLTLLLLVLIATKIFFIDALNRSIDNDIQNSALDLVMQADAYIVIYHQVYGALPESLPDETLRPFISYQKLDETQYSLQLPFTGHNQLILQDINQTLTVEKVQETINLDNLN